MDAFWELQLPSDFYFPTDLRPGGLRVQVLKDYERGEVSVTFSRGDAVALERTYLEMSWTKHAYDRDLQTALERGRHEPTKQDSQTEEQGIAANRRAGNDRNADS